MPLGPDPIGLRVELLHTPFGVGGEPDRLLSRPVEAVLGVASRLRGYLGGGLMRALEDPGDLLAHALQGPPHGGLGRARRLQLGDELTGLAYVCVDREAVIAAKGERELDVGDGGHRIVWKRRQRLGDLLQDGVLYGC